MLHSNALSLFKIVVVKTYQNHFVAFDEFLYRKSVQKCEIDKSFNDGHTDIPFNLTIGFIGNQFHSQFCDEPFFCSDVVIYIEDENFFL